MRRSRTLTERYIGQRIFHGGYCKYVIDEEVRDSTANHVSSHRRPSMMHRLYRNWISSGLERAFTNERLGKEHAPVRDRKRRRLGSHHRA